jgi:ABC-2 type transport system permease protein
VTLNTDMTKGVVDRFRTLPIWRAAPLVGAMLGDSVRYVFAGTIVMLVGIALGFDPEGGVLGVLAGVALVVLFSFALAWVFTALGALLRAPNAVMNAGFMGLFPLIFLSNIFVDPETLPRGLEAFVDVNPISHLVTAVRAAMAGDFDGGAVAVVAGTAVALTAIFAPLTVHLYRGRG